MIYRILTLPNKVRLGQNFIVRIRLRKPKTPGGRRYYDFSIEPVYKKKFRHYWSQTSPGAVKATFQEVK